MASPLDSIRQVAKRVAAVVAHAFHFADSRTETNQCGSPSPITSAGVAPVVPTGSLIVSVLVTLADRRATGDDRGNGLIAIDVCIARVVQARLLHSSALGT